METPVLRRGTSDRSSHEISDKYTASIELSNACRHFYNSRVEASASMKVKIQERSTEKKESTTTNKRRWGINEAMDKLREEMVSLMDQDLTLMKQLLNLNETIEDLKWQRNNYYSGSSSEESDFSVSETEMYAESSDNDVPHTKVSKSISNLHNKRPEEITSDISVDNCYVQKASLIPSQKSVAAESTIPTNVSHSLTNLHKGHSEYRSIDSGINDTDHVEIRV